MPFTLTMAWRETRASWRHFLYFLVCIALGVGTLVGVGMFAAHVEQTVAREARGLMGGDVEVRLSRPVSVQGLAVLQSLGGRGVAVLHVSELVAMASRPAGSPPAEPTSGSAPIQIIELKAVDPAYPFYGVLKTAPDRPLSQLITTRADPCRADHRSGPNALGRNTTRT